MFYNAQIDVWNGNARWQAWVWNEKLLKIIIPILQKGG